MAAVSAAICLWHWAENDSTDTELKVLIVHPGGPYWAKKDEGAWSFPKGEFDPDSESSPDAARREFEEETGHAVPSGELVSLGEARLKSGKVIEAWAVEGYVDADQIRSNTFEMEWPPRTGRRQEFPEVDRAVWCTVMEAAQKLNPAQVVFLERLATSLS